MFDDDPKAVMWSGRITNTVGFLLALYLIRLETYKIKTSNSPQPKVLIVFEFGVLISAALCTSSSIANFVHVTCKYTLPLHAIFISAQRLFLTFYQIGRLQYCFSNQSQTTNYGFSKYTFIVLYLIGSVILCTNMIISPVIFPINLMENYGCTYGDLNSQIYFYALFIIAISYYLWDWYVLAMYVFKLIQIKWKIRHNDSNKKATALRNVQSILNKILILTILYEISSFLILVVPILIVKSNYFNVHHVILESFDSILAAVIIYFMVDNNQKQYHPLVNTLLCKICNKSSENNELNDATSTYNQNTYICQQLEVSSYNTNDVTKNTVNYAKSGIKFNIHNRFIENAKIIYTQLICIGYNELISQMISEFAATRFMNCIMCEQSSVSCIECVSDYCILYGTFANYDENNKLRFFLNFQVENGYSKIDNNESNFYIDKEIICSKCAMNWKCTICDSLYLINDYDNT
eukprot:326849_1